MSTNILLIREFIMLIKKRVGIASYGAYLPRQAIALQEIEQANSKKAGSVSGSLKVEQKTVPETDEDTITIAVSAAHQALDRIREFYSESDQIFPKEKIGALFIGSESHPYAVKPSGTVTAQALGLSQNLAMADLQFACKAGTQGMQICASYVLSGLSEHGLAIGADTAQAKPGDALEYTAAAGGAAYIFGKKQLVARLLAANSFASDTPDFWRRAGESYPEHGGRFTGEPAYFKHILTSARALLQEAKLKPKEIDYCVFHTPNGKFPRRAAKKLGFSEKQLTPSLVVEQVGNTYSGAVPLALAAVLDQAQFGQKILVTAYGSGAGADSFLFETTGYLPKYHRHCSEFVLDQVKQLEKINYSQYLKLNQERQH